MRRQFVLLLICFGHECCTLPVSLPLGLESIKIFLEILKYICLLQVLLVECEKLLIDLIDVLSRVFTLAPQVFDLICIVDCSLLQLVLGLLVFLDVPVQDYKLLKAFPLDSLVVHDCLQVLYFFFCQVQLRIELMIQHAFVFFTHILDFLGQIVEQRIDLGHDSFDFPGAVVDESLVLELYRRLQVEFFVLDCFQPTFIVERSSLVCSHSETFRWENGAH